MDRGDIETNDWVSSLNRDRYCHVKDERDAYMELHDDFSSQVKTTMEKLKAALREKQHLDESLSAEKRMSASHFAQVRPR